MMMNTGYVDVFANGRIGTPAVLTLWNILRRFDGLSAIYEDALVEFQRLINEVAY